MNRISCHFGAFLSKVRGGQKRAGVVSEPGVRLSMSIHNSSSAQTGSSLTLPSALLTSRKHGLIARPPPTSGCGLSPSHTSLWNLASVSTTATCGVMESRPRLTGGLEQPPNWYIYSSPVFHSLSRQIFFSLHHSDHIYFPA